MKTLPLAIALLAALATVPAAAGSAAVTVTLDVDLAGEDYKTCAVSVPSGATAGDVLDAAVADGCLVLWTYETYPGFGRYVTCIDAFCGAVATYWAFYTDGRYSDLGIDSVRVYGGETLRFNYEQWVVPS